AVSEDRVSMSVRKSQTALRAIKRCECSRYLEQIDELLVLPPGELLVVSRLMIRERDVIEGRGVEPVTIAFKQRAVIFEVLRHVSMAMHVAAINLVLLAVVADNVAANGLNISCVIVVNWDRFDERLGEELKRRQCKRRLSAGAEPGAVDISVARNHRAERTGIC